MCANSQINAKKEQENQTCWLRNSKVFVYFTNLKLREFASALFFECVVAAKIEKKRETQTHKYA
jgi:hypothetical protein